MTARNQSPVEPPAPGQSSSTTENAGEVGPLAHLYTVLADVLRDQLASQLETASTNDLKSVGVLGAALAVVVALLLLRATDPHGIGVWWWPLPAFVLPGILAAVPLRRPKRNVKFLDGPSVPGLLARYERGRSGDGSLAYTLEEQLAMLLVDLQDSWNNNDRLLAEEGRSFYWGALSLAVVTLVSVGLYAWGLS
ncbi:MAG: hypothetical protein ACYDC0_11240 [Acidimicrobiales bacterium]